MDFSLEKTRKTIHMTKVKKFEFSPFQENTYVLYDETKECIIIDPGCYDERERKELVDFIEKNELKPVRLINTHCHLDHVFGNKFVADKYGLILECHEGELAVLQFAAQAAKMYGVQMEPSPLPGKYIEEGDVISFGKTKLSSILTPGHSPASLCFFCEADNFLIAGDTLFRLSIGRTDLPGGNHETLLRSIKEKIFPLGDKVVVYSGHMEETTIGYEKVNNPFVGERAIH